MRVVKILPPAPKLFPLDYLEPEGLNLEIGDIVIIPFRNKETIGIVWEFAGESSFSNLKTVARKVPFDIKINSHLRLLMEKAADYYCSEISTVAKLVLPIDFSAGSLKTEEPEILARYSLPPLSNSQEESFRLIKSSDRPVLLNGATGSGKTEIYFKLAAESLESGKQVFVALPEIALGSQIISRFEKRFGFSPTVWNSSVSLSKKKSIFRSIASGKAKIIIGARSALFLPYKNLGSIIIDEEQDASYKQEEGFTYNARDMAVLRGSLEGAKVLLCSATPSTESLYNAKIGKYREILLPSRYGGASLPKVEIIDMGKDAPEKDSFLSPSLIKAVKKNWSLGLQSLLFLNRRGYSPLTLCSSCSYRFTCKYCSSWTVFHKSSGKMECHLCGYKAQAPTYCPECLKTDSLRSVGCGIEKITEEASRLFPGARIETLSGDSPVKELTEKVRQIERGEVDIIIGTKIIVKGYHFPKLTLVGIIDADIGAFGGDLKSGENSFQLLHQAAGRSGRENLGGEVFVQTYYPDNLIYRALKNHDLKEFTEYELSGRESSFMPPFSRCACIVFSGKNETKTYESAKNFVSFAPKAQGVGIFGPARPVAFKLSGKYRYKIMVRAPKNFNLGKYLKSWKERIGFPSSVTLKIDIDPRSFF